MDIRIGTSGFSYEDWRGHFYPPGLQRAEMLTYYARCFPAVEINASYYRVPDPASVARMVRKVGKDFEFVLKAHRDMTHGDSHRPESFSAFRAALEPLREAGMLGGVLAQFPWSFQRSTAGERFLRLLRDELDGVPVVVEFRNAGWADAECLELLRSLSLGFCCVDEPRLRGLMPPVAAVTADPGYVRFHGRNAAKWWQHEHAWERYNYLYPAAELEEWAGPIRDLAARAEKTYVFFNNHYQGKAAHNARQMAELLGRALPPPPPAQGSLVLE